MLFGLISKRSKPHFIDRLVPLKPIPRKEPAGSPSWTIRILQTIQVIVFVSGEGIRYKADRYDDLEAEFPLELFSNDKQLLLIGDNEVEFICFNIS